jgi:sorting nexin-1/2
LIANKKLSPPELEVCDPQLKADTIGKHHLYKVKGRDHQGEFEVFRRFKQFDLLRRTLFSRFLGLYVPSLPEKKAMGKTDQFFVQERMHHLNAFLKEISQLPYLYESQEFQLFMRPPGDLDVCFT